jgi:hypothetical protein
VAAAESPSRPCDRPRLAIVTVIALRRLERLAGHNVDHASVGIWLSLIFGGVRFQILDRSRDVFGPIPKQPRRCWRFMGYAVKFGANICDLIICCLFGMNNLFYFSVECPIIACSLFVIPPPSAIV